ncbi:MAG: AMP-binding protein [Bacteroidota bacterium]
MKSIHENLETLPGMFYHWEKTTPNNVFLRQPSGDIWTTYTFKEVGEQARKLVNAFRSQGLKKGDHIALISKNCAHWIIADLAIMMGGYVSVPLYASLSADQMTLVLEKSDAKALIVGKLDEWAKKSKGLIDGMPVFRFPYYAGNAEVTQGMSWDDAMKNEPMEGNPEPDIDELWTILFTSGTTGTPKGVMHPYKTAALLNNNEKVNNILKTFEPGETRLFSFLPLNHIAERTAVELSGIGSGGTISFADTLDTFAKNLAETRPTFFFAVPRIWTKFQLGVLAKMPQKKLDTLLKIPIVSGIIKKKLLKALGLDAAKVCLTGASITPESLKQWYRKLGLNLREVYGMTENAGGFTMMPEHKHKPNTVGKPLPNAEGRIDPDTGEILMKMPWMMTGYYKEPELTAETLVDGWLHTGDKGKLDDEGFLKIVGRVKDAFKTTKGKFIVPTIIEDHFSNNSLIEQICVAGLGIPQPVALVCLSEIGMKEDKAKVTENLQSEVQRVNGQLHNHERISTIIVANEPWSPENKLLTPTLKIRRGAINDAYGERLSAWHEAPDKVIWES